MWKPNLRTGSYVLRITAYGIVTTAAEKIVTAHDRILLVEHGGHIHLTYDWALSLSSCMGYVKSKANTKANVHNYDRSSSSR